MRRIGILLTIVVLAAGCSGGDEDETAESSTTPSSETTVVESTTTTEATTTTTEPTTTTTEATTTEGSASGSDDTIDLEALVESGDLDALEEVLGSAGGRAQIIDSITEAIPAITRTQASCLLDEIDPALVLALQGIDDPATALDQIDPETLNDAFAALTVCEIPLDSLLGG